MNQSKDSISETVSDDIKELLSLMNSFRESYVELKNEYEKVQTANATLKNALQIAQENDKQNTFFRCHSESVVVQQNKIIGDFVNVKEENFKLKEQLNKVNETLQNSYKEIDKLRNRSADELKALEDSHVEEMQHLVEQYQKQEKRKEETFLEHKEQMESVITKLEQTVESLQTEKNVVLEVTVREYEDRLKTLMTALEESKVERKALEDRNIANMNMYTKRLECQEQNYISMLETVRKEVQSANEFKSINRFKHKEQNKPDVSSYPASSVRPVCNMPVQVLNKMKICNELQHKNDLPVNVSYYNHLQIPLPYLAHRPQPRSTITTPANITDNDSNNKNNNNNDMKKDFYDCLNVLRTKGAPVNTVAEHNYNDTDCKINTHCNTYINKLSDTVSKISIPKKRKLFNPEDQDNLI